MEQLKTWFGEKIINVTWKCNISSLRSNKLIFISFLTCQKQQLLSCGKSEGTHYFFCALWWSRLLNHDTVIEGCQPLMMDIWPNPNLSNLALNFYLAYVYRKNSPF